MWLFDSNVFVIDRAKIALLWLIYSFNDLYSQYIFQHNIYQLFLYQL